MRYCIMPSVPPAYTQKPDQLIVSLLRAKWSQEAIADAVGISQPTVSRILSGAHKDPRYSVVERLRQLVLNLDEFSAGEA